MTIGITGGIGSGKSTIAEVLEKMGYAVFYADLQAKALYHDSAIKSQMCDKFGDDIYINGQINRKKLGEIVFNDDKALHFVNNLIHPRVADKFAKWKDNQKDKVNFLESALLLEEGSTLSADQLWLVDADESKRIQRVMLRDGASVDNIKAIMNRQKGIVRNKNKANYVIQNNDEMLIPQILKALAKIG